MDYTEQRKWLRGVLTGSECISPASVYDALSARVAESVGYKLGMLAGSVASQTTLASPDLIVLTLTEFADQIRRIMRASKLALLVDADHGYGNALNAMRTVEEVEHAGASAMSIEDTVLPMAYAQPEDQVISNDEMVKKLRAAVAARRDPNFIILGRTTGLRSAGLDETVKRVKAYSDTGVDGIFIVGLETMEQIDAIHKATSLPIVLGNAPATLKREDLAALGARILLQGHQPIFAVAKTLRETYEHLYKGGAPGDLRDNIFSPAEMDKVTAGDDHKRWIAEYLR
jgi:carboxyvinyl-carboxyphosphonate phosphorylmutase